jgi:antitoxin component of RelBE/YafQ-DinJ toxin-antitoxin module
MKNTFMKVRVTRDEQAEWRDVCRALGQDFSTIVRDTMKRRAALAKRKERVTDETG